MLEAACGRLLVDFVPEFFWMLSRASALLQTGCGVGPDRVEHGVQAIGASGGEVLAQTDLPDEIGLGVDDLLRAAA